MKVRYTITLEVDEDPAHYLEEGEPLALLSRSVLLDRLTGWNEPAELVGNNDIEFSAEIVDDGTFPGGLLEQGADLIRNGLEASEQAPQETTSTIQWRDLTDADAWVIARAGGPVMVMSDEPFMVLNGEETSFAVVEFVDVGRVEAVDSNGDPIDEGPLYELFTKGATEQRLVWAELPKWPEGGTR